MSNQARLIKLNDRKEVLRDGLEAMRLSLTQPTLLAPFNKLGVPQLGLIAISNETRDSLVELLDLILE